MGRLSLNNVMGVFNKALTKLEAFTEQCDSDISVCQSRIDEAEREKRVVESERQRAVQSLEKIKEIVG